MTTTIHNIFSSWSTNQCISYCYWLFTTRSIDCTSTCTSICSIYDNYWTKGLAGMQRRIGPNVVGYYGTLQPFADALKLVVKEMIIPQHATRSLFFLAPIISLVFSLLGWAVIPFGSGLTLTDFSLGILYTMAISSVGVYGILFAGWSANSKYAFLGSLRSTAQMISYELILSSVILTIIILTGTFNITTIIEDQQAVWL